MPEFRDFEGQSQHIARLQKEFSRHEEAHAYLFAGPSGTGKRSVALLCAAARLCRGEEKPCGACGPCRRVFAGTHPDVHILLPEKGKRDIGVGVMREALSEASVRPLEGEGKLFLVPEADRMNPQAQNALLKTLEEPPEDTVFLLSASRPAALLPTILSRVRLIRFHPLSAEDASKRLQELGMDRAKADAAAVLSEGCVGAALALDENALFRRRELTARFFGVRRAADIPAVLAAYKDEKIDRAALLSGWEASVRDVTAACFARKELPAEAYAEEARNYARTVPPEAALRLTEATLAAKKMLSSYVSFQAVLETVLLEIAEEYEKWPW